RGQATSQERRSVGKGSRCGGRDRGSPHGDEVPQGDEHSQFAAASRLEQCDRTAPGKRQRGIVGTACALKIVLTASSQFAPLHPTQETPGKTAFWPHRWRLPGS